MSAAILQFVPRPKPKPQPPALNITEAECRLLDRVKEVSDRVLDVVNTDQALIRSFLAGDQTIQATFKHLGREYSVRVSLEESNNSGPRVA